MLLTIDIGNTNITLGAYRDEKILFVSRMFTARNKTSDEFAAELLNIFKLYEVGATEFSKVVMSCVVPEIEDSVIRAVKMITGKKPAIVGAENHGSFKIDILPVSAVGADLICAAVAAKAKYPLPCLVADLGTATKIIVVDRDGRFVGCTISPGVKISMDALAAKASLLPSVSFKAPEKAVGANTAECIQSGVVFGTAAMLDGLIRRISNELSLENATVVATGGYSRGIIPCCETEIIYDENLILDGLFEISRDI
ncbi:MAG: type III pantothenate kinase [Oscillospiraceae bacterium]|nr:type III pantothenate kinase [Oscillospiraceae bacterium]